MNKKDLLKLVKRAHDELTPKGIEHAWENYDGTVLKWSDLLKYFEQEVAKEKPQKEEPKDGTV